MAKIVLCVAFVVLFGSSCVYSKDTAANLVWEIYSECLSQYSVECVKPRSLAWVSRVANDDEIKITEDLTILKTDADQPEESTQEESRSDSRYALFDGIESFLSTHSLKVKVPEEISGVAAAEYVPRSLLTDLPKELNMPLTDAATAEGRGFVKKVVIPFLLGLKFKAAVLVPLALALIALKTWKALTLGLISLVLSGAMVIFKFTKPKVVNYEVIHYPQHHVEHHVDHAPTGWDAHHAPYQARNYNDAQQMAYGAQL